jgi:ERCC4-type nuclease
MLISPAEPPFLKELGISSSVPEQYGADFLIFCPLGMVGIQRKELSDLVASHNDDRIARELISMKELDIAVWLIEGAPQWSSDGQSLWTRSNYTLSRHLGFLFTLLSQGFWLLSTATITESGLLLSQLEKWLRKEKHNGINGRTPPRGMFGQPDDNEWRVHFLSGLPGLGSTRASAILEHFGGLPLALTGDLSTVPGVGKKTAERVERIFRGNSE